MLLLCTFVPNLSTRAAPQVLCAVMLWKVVLCCVVLRCVVHCVMVPRRHVLKYLTYKGALCCNYLMAQFYYSPQQLARTLLFSNHVLYSNTILSAIECNYGSFLIVGHIAAILVLYCGALTTSCVVLALEVCHLTSSFCSIP
jgi:hypothetical protein